MTHLQTAAFGAAARCANQHGGDGGSTAGRVANLRDREPKAAQPIVVGKEASPPSGAMTNDDDHGDGGGTGTGTSAATTAPTMKSCRRATRARGATGDIIII